MSHPDTDKGDQKNIIKNKKAIINVEFKKDMLRIQEDCSAWPEKLSMWLINLILVYTKKPSFFSKSFFFFGEADAEKNK